MLYIRGCGESVQLWSLFIEVYAVVWVCKVFGCLSSLLAREIQMAYCDRL